MWERQRKQRKGCEEKANKDEVNGKTMRKTIKLREIKRKYGSLSASEAASKGKNQTKEMVK